MQSRTQMEQALAGWDVERTDGWFVAVPQSPQVHKVFEARTLRVLMHKIQLWSRSTGCRAAA